MDLWVDFNDMDSKGQVVTLRRFASPGFDLSVGATVVVGDDEGTLCRGVIADVSGQAVVLHLDLGTFQSTDSMAMACA